MHMSEIEDYGVTVEEYLEGLAAGIDMRGIEKFGSKGYSHKSGSRGDGNRSQGGQWYSYTRRNL